MCDNGKGNKDEVFFFCWWNRGVIKDISEEKNGRKCNRLSWNMR